MKQTTTTTTTMMMITTTNFTQSKTLFKLSLNEQVIRLLSTSEIKRILYIPEHLTLTSPLLFGGRYIVATTHTCTLLPPHHSNNKRPQQHTVIEINSVKSNRKRRALSSHQVAFASLCSLRTHAVCRL